MYRAVFADNSQKAGLPAIGPNSWQTRWSQSVDATLGPYQLPVTRLIRTWRTLSEAERIAHFRSIPAILLRHHWVARVNEECKNLDLSAFAFDEFVAFFFARNVVPGNEQYEYFSTDLNGEKYDDFVPSSPDRLVNHLTKLITEFASIATKYTSAQVDQAIWGLWSIRCLQQFLFERMVPLESRVGCIRAMSHVYIDYVSKREKDPDKDDDGGIWMWWDLIVHDFWVELICEKVPLASRVDPSTYNAVPVAYRDDPSTIDSESRILLEAMFETLTAILAIPNRSSQQSALHGLGHLYHPSVHDTVQRFIDSNPTGFELKWLEQCRDCRVL